MFTFVSEEFCKVGNKLIESELRPCCSLCSELVNSVGESE